MFYRKSLCTRSKAFLKSMKLLFSDIWNSKLCSTIFLRIKICSMHKRTLRNPTCSCWSISSVAALIQCSNIVQNSLLGTDSSMTPLQLLQSLMLPFFGILTINPFLHSSGTCCLSSRDWGDIAISGSYHYCNILVAVGVFGPIQKLWYSSMFVFPFLLLQLLLAPHLLETRLLQPWLSNRRVHDGIGWFLVSLKCSAQRTFSSLSFNSILPMLAFD